MPAKIKAFTILLLWLSIGLTMVLAVQGIAIRAVLVCVASGVTTHIALIRKRGPKDLDT